MRWGGGLKKQDRDVTQHGLERQLEPKAGRV